MKFSYDRETDSLYIALSEETSSESEEIAPGVVADYDQSGKIVGLDIQHASQTINMNRLELNAMPFGDIALSA
jgi:uncharacterized protein YuzE